jgi:alpha-tubulin suppressor-like RCC1 family protein
MEDFTPIEDHVPVDVVGLSSGAIALSAGDDHTCAVTEQGGVVCWGINAFGQLGDGSDINRTAPTAVAGLSAAAHAVSGGGSHTCAAMTPAGVQCWGVDGYEISLVPVSVSGLDSKVISISAGGGYTCAVTSNGRVWCWGNNAGGQLGDGTNDHRATPGPVVGF